MIASVIIRLQHGVGSDPDRLAKVLARLQSDPRIESGDIVDQRCVPATLDCASGDAADDLTRWLQSMPEVEFVDVVFAFLEPGEARERYRNDCRPEHETTPASETPESSGWKNG